MTMRTSGASWEEARALLRAMEEGRVMPDLARTMAHLTTGRVAPRPRSLMHQVCAEYYGLVGMRDEALAAVEAAAALPSVDLLWMDHCPTLEALRDDARFSHARAVIAARVAELWE
jgi:hypothetical protein